MILSFALSEKDYGAVLATKSAPDDKITALMTKMKTMTAQPLSSYSHEWKVLPQHVAEIAATKPLRDSPDGMVKIPAGTFTMKVHGIEIEGFERYRRRHADAMGGFAAPLSRTCHGHEIVLDRQISGDERTVQEDSSMPRNITRRMIWTF